MRISAGDIVALLRKIDEVEEKAGVAFTTCDQQDLQIALDKARELRPMLYAALASSAEEGTPYPVPYPAIVPQGGDAPWWETTRVTCGPSSGAQ